MKVRLLHTVGDGKFTETEWTKPEPSSDQIEVKSVMTGVCRSDIDMMNGKFGPLPLTMSGHEGLGVVTKVGKRVVGIKEGDYVATRGEPAYADYYNARSNEFVKVPELQPKYIVEPVACALNMIQSNKLLTDLPDGKSVLILGSGFLSSVIYASFPSFSLHFDRISVVGSHNSDVFGTDLVPDIPDEQFDVIIDLSHRTDYLDGKHLNNEGLIIMGVEKQINQNIGPLLWKAARIVFPSPRNNSFIYSMLMSVMNIQSGAIKPESFWTKGYDRDTEWQQAFIDGNNRPNGYSRGYIQWR